MTADEECAPQCAAGFTKIKTQTGLNIPVFNIKRTSPALHIGYGNNICYAELLPGESDKAINVRYNNAIYHTWANESETRCDAGYYLLNGICTDCGNGYYCTGDNSRRLCRDLVPPIHCQIYQR